MSNNNLTSIETFFRSRCNYKQILALDALVLKTELGDEHEAAITQFIQSTIKEVMSNVEKA